MAIAFRNAASGSTANANTTPVSVTKPAGVVDGDVMVAFGAINIVTTGTWTPPAGWTSIADTGVGAQLSAAVWYKVASSEGASYSWSSSAAIPAAVTIVAYSGCSASGIPDSNGGIVGTGSSTSTPVTSSTTTVADLSVVIACWTGRAASARTINSDPAGYTNRAVNTAQINAQLFIDDKIGKTPAGAEGAQTLTLNASLAPSGGILISLAPVTAAQFPYQPVYQSGPILAQ